jgi:hypothetical protein
MSAYSDLILSTGPYYYYRCSDVDGTMLDSSANARNGTYSGGYTQSVASLLNEAGDSAVTLNGSNGVATCAGVNLTGISTITIALLATRPVTAPGGNGEALVNGGFGSSLNQAGMGFNPGSGKFSMIDKGNWRDSSAAAPIDGQAHLYHLVISGTSAKLYKDGIQVLSSNVDTNLTNYNPFVPEVGHGYIAASYHIYLAGTVDEVAVWASALTAGQISAQALAFIQPRVASLAPSIVNSGPACSAIISTINNR